MTHCNNCNAPDFCMERGKCMDQGDYSAHILHNGEISVSYTRYDTKNNHIHHNIIASTERLNVYVDKNELDVVN